MTPSIRTERLELIPATRDMLERDRDNRKALARLLNAVVPGSWPPPLMDEETLREFIRMSTGAGRSAFSVWYWIHDDPPNGRRTLVGSGGVVGSAHADDTVVLGYSVLDEYQNQGYATEAIHALIPVVFSRGGICRIIATTCPDSPASVRVLEKTGFLKTDYTSSGAGAEEGTVCYSLEKR